MSTVRQNIAQVLRGFRRNPAYSTLIVLTLAVGIGSNAAVFGILRRVAADPLPFPDANRLVLINQLQPTGFPASVSLPNVLDWREMNRSFESMGAFQYASGTVTSPEGEPEVEEIVRVLGELFVTTGTEPTVGRLFAEGETELGAEPIVVISHGMWESRFQRDPDAIGTALAINGRPFTIIGVAPPDFRLPAGDAAAYVPMGFYQTLQWNDRYTSSGTEVVARLAPGVTVADASADMVRISAAIEAQTGEDESVGQVMALASRYVGDLPRRLSVLMVAVGFVLILACANVANLILVRSERRRSEIMVRSAMGASRKHLLSQFLTESAMFSVVGMLVGLLFESLTRRLVLSSVGASLPDTVLARIGFDGSIFLFMALACGLAALLTGALPALRASGERFTRLAGQRFSARSPFATGLVVVQVAISLILLVSAGLLMRTLSNLEGAEKGFDTEQILTTRIRQSSATYSTPDLWRDFYMTLREEVRAIPGVEEVGVTSLFPFSFTYWEMLIRPESEPDPDNSDSVLYTMADPGYFRTLGIELVEGRGFTEADDWSSTPVAIIDEMLAERYWPGESPIGKRVTFEFVDNQQSEGPLYREVVGVVRHVRAYSLTENVRMEIYAPFRQTVHWGLRSYLVVRAPNAGDGLAAQIRSRLRAVDPNVPMYRVRTMEEALEPQLAPSRALRSVLLAFGAVALLLSTLGIYGVVSFSAEQRKRELGVRLACGARSGQVGWLILSDGARMVAIGLVGGAVGLLAFTSALRSLLFGVAPMDPTSVAVSALLVTVVTLVATYVPAHRALSMDPVRALREE